MGSCLPGSWDETCGNKLSQRPDVAQSCQTAVWAGKRFKGCRRKEGPGAPITHTPPRSKCILRGMTCMKEGWEGKGLTKDSWGNHVSVSSYRVTSYPSCQ